MYLTTALKSLNIWSLKSLPLLIDTVRFKLACLYLVSIALLLLLFCGAVYFSFARTALLSVDDGLRAMAQQLTATYSSSDGLLHVQGSHINTIDRLGNLEMALLVNTRGDVVQKLGVLTDQTTRQMQQIAVNANDSTIMFVNSNLFVRKFSTQTVAANYRVLVVHILHDGKENTRLVLAAPRSDEHELQVLLRVLLLTSGVTLLVAAGAGYWFAKRALYPVKIMTQTIQNIDENDLSSRLNMPPRGELGELASTFDHMLDRLEDAFRRLLQFTSDASHELRTPLTVIDVMVKEALIQSTTLGEYRYALTTIQAENDHMIRLVKHLLIVARAENGQSQLQKHVVDIGDVTLDTIERLLPLARKKHIHLRFGELPELYVLGDTLYLALMLTNLIENGIKYTAGIGSRVEVAIGNITTEKGDLVWISVVDDGPGIDKNDVPYIFDRFYRIDKARVRPSELADGDEVLGDSSNFGLGLALAQWVALAHGGELHVQTTIGQGTIFRVELPLYTQTSSSCVDGKEYTVR